MGVEQSISQLILFLVMGGGAVAAALWMGLVLWTWRDMKARSREPVAQLAAALVVAVLNVFGLIIYLLLRPRETLTEAYERSLEEEALLQGIEEKPACPGCGRPAQNRWQVCPYCHTRLKKTCANCKELLELGWNLCPYCATVQAAPEGEPRRRAAGRTASVRSNPPVRRETPSPDAQLEFVEGEE
ncbi:MAG: zinc ribbon domain-containing protein [Anaerolinea sp.]|nr:zinc ribbon domain-containing protein [Anaerolinea sp.]CAG0988547.1 hypothetical protein ANRL4_02316 [Anaerolineae bacterium]